MANNVTWKLKKSIMDYIIPVSRVLVFIFLSVAAFFFQFWQEQYARKLDEKEFTIGELSVLLKGLPCGEGYENLDVNELLNSEILKLGYRIAKTNFLFNCDRYHEIIDELKDLAMKRYKKEFLDKSGNLIEYSLNKVRQLNENELLLA